MTKYRIVWAWNSTYAASEAGMADSGQGIECFQRSWLQGVADEANRHEPRLRHWIEIC